MTLTVQESIDALDALFVAKGRTASIHCRPAPPRQTEALSSRTSRSQPLKTSQPSGARAKNERSESVQGS